MKPKYNEIKCIKIKYNFPCIFNSNRGGGVSPSYFISDRTFMWIIIIYLFCSCILLLSDINSSFLLCFLSLFLNLLLSKAVGTQYIISFSHAHFTADGVENMLYDRWLLKKFLVNHNPCGLLFVSLVMHWKATVRGLPK